MLDVLSFGKFLNETFSDEMLSDGILWIFRFRMVSYFRLLGLKGVCHEIFYLQFFHDSNPDKQAKVFSNSVSISSRYSIT